MIAALLILALLAPASALAECVTLQFQTAGDLALSGSTGSWVGDASAIGSDDIRAIGPTISNNAKTPYLRFSNINTGLLYDGVTITGVSFSWEGRSTVVGAAEFSVVAVDDLGAASTENKASYIFSSTNTDVTVTKGDESDDWAVGFCYDSDSDCATSSQINLADDDSGFAVAFVQEGATSTSVRIDNATLEVCFTGEGTPTPTSTPTATPTATPTSTPTQTHTPVPDWTCEAVAFATPASSVDQGGAAGAWTSPNNAVVEDGSRAQSASLSTANSYTQRLYLRNLATGATGIAEGDVILGVELTYNGQVTGTEVVEHEVYIVDDSGAVVGANGARPTPYASTATDYDRTRGAEFALWGVNWCAKSSGDCANPASVNILDADTGVQLSYIRQGSGVGLVQRVDSASLRVCYGPPPPTAPPTNTPTATPTATATSTPTHTPTATRTVAVSETSRLDATGVPSKGGRWHRYEVATDGEHSVAVPATSRRLVLTDLSLASTAAASVKVTVGGATIGEYHLAAGRPLVLRGLDVSGALGADLRVERTAGVDTVSAALRLVEVP